MSSYTVAVCPAEKLDPFVPMILSKWLRSLRWGNDYFRLCDQDAFFNTYQPYVIGLLQRKGTEVRLAALTEDPDIVLGFSVTRGSILDYVHVHRDYRRIGIGRRLVPAGITAFSHLTKQALSIYGSGKLPGIVFNPFC